MPGRGCLLVLHCLMAAARLGAAAGDEAREYVLRRSLPAYGLASAAAAAGLEPAAAESIRGDDCRGQLDLFRRSVDERRFWAVKMLDSSGAPKPGFVYGNNYWLGSRNQCLDLENRKPFVLQDDVMGNNSRLRDSNEEFPPYKLNYYVAYFRHNSTMQYHVRLPNEDLISLGLCLPASCSTDELGSLLSLMFREKSLIVGELFFADFQLMQVRDLKDDHLWLLTGKFIFIKILLVLVLMLLLIGTMYDVFVHQKRSKKEIEMEIYGNNNERIKLNDNLEANVLKRRRKFSTFGKILLCFSVYSNTKLLFKTKLSGDSVAPIHGLRFLGMVWIVMVHTIFYMSDYADNKPWSWRMADGFAVQVLSNSTLSVDTFFFLSGFLVAYMYFTSHKNERESSCTDSRRKVTEFVVGVIRRFIRLTPAYMMMVGILQLNAAWYGKTSLFYMTERPQDVCDKYWWRNILYINNLFGRKTMCMTWSWYLSNDMQFFIIGLFLLILSSAFFYTAVTILFLLLIGSIIVTGYISYVNNYVPTMDQQYHMLEVLYDPPWTRIGPYIVGIVTAYIITRLKSKLLLKRRTVVAGWLLGSSCNLFVLFGLCERQISILLASFYVAFSRTVWAVGLAWLLIACCTNHGGIVNKILCFKAWIPLSRLTYCAYLLNPFIINSIYLHSESSVHVDFLPNGATFLGSLMGTYLCSFALSLALETPIVLLMRLLFNVKK